MTEQILQFMQNHWMLCTAGVVVLSLIIFEELKDRIAGSPKISAQDTSLMQSRENALVVDLRNQKKFADGHILGSLNIVRADIEQHLKKIETHKDKALILVDDQDTGASQIRNKLHTKGFTKIFVLAGGINAWLEAKLPLTKKD